MATKGEVGIQYQSQMVEKAAGRREMVWEMVV